MGLAINSLRQVVGSAGRAIFSCSTISLAVIPAVSYAAGTPAGTIISNVAEVTFELDGETATQLSDPVRITVIERIDVAVTLQSGQVLASAGDVDRSLLFTVTNTGNGNETFSLAIDSNLTADDFNPIPATPPIYFDTDGSGDYTAGDTAYDPGINDPQLDADESVNVLLVNEIPGTALNGQLGHSELTATSTTGTGNPGDSFPGLGDANLDAIVGTSGGEAAQFGVYLVSDVQIAILKSVSVSDPFGGQEPVPGATLQYSVTVQVTNSGTATAATFRDAVPTGTTFTADSITLDGDSLTDDLDADAGEVDTSGTPTVVVRLGDLDQGDGVRTVVFEVTID